MPPPSPFTSWRARASASERTPQVRGSSAFAWPLWGEYGTFGCASHCGSRFAKTTQRGSPANCRMRRSLRAPFGERAAARSVTAGSGHGRLQSGIAIATQEAFDGRPGGGSVRKLLWTAPGHYRHPAPRHRGARPESGHENSRKLTGRQPPERGAFDGSAGDVARAPAPGQRRRHGRGLGWSSSRPILTSLKLGAWRRLWRGILFERPPPPVCFFVPASLSAMRNRAGRYIQRLLYTWICDWRRLVGSGPALSRVSSGGGFCVFRFAPLAAELRIAFGVGHCGPVPGCHCSAVYGVSPRTNLSKSSLK